MKHCRQSIDRSRYETLLTEADLNRWVEKLNQAKLFALDTETDNLDYMSANLVGISFALENGEAAYLPLQLDYLGAPKTLEKTTALALLKPVLEILLFKKSGKTSSTTSLFSPVMALMCKVWLSIPCSNPMCSTALVVIIWTIWRSVI